MQTRSPATLDRALVLLSGGIDSAVVAALAARRHAYVHFLTIDYGQTNAREIVCAGGIARRTRNDAPHSVLRLDMSACAAAGRSGLLAGAAVGAPRRYGHYVPGRNMIFLAHAAAIAEAHDLSVIYLGSNMQDAAGPAVEPGGAPAGYPDSGSDFLRLAEPALNAGLKFAEWVHLEAPLLDMPKFAAVRLGRAMGVDFSGTWSCYGNRPDACGRCGACRARLLAFHWAGTTDPVACAGGNRRPLVRTLAAGTSSHNASEPADSVAPAAMVAQFGATRASLRDALERLESLFKLEPCRVDVEWSGRGRPSPAFRIAEASARSYNHWTRLARGRPIPRMSCD